MALWGWPRLKSKCTDLALDHAVADPRFPRGGAPTQKIRAQAYYLAKYFMKNCKKIKEIEPRGMRVPSTPPPIHQWNALTTPVYANDISGQQM